MKMYGIQLPYGKPLDWNDLTYEQQLEITEHQFRTKDWRKRVVNKEMTQHSHAS